MHSLKVSVRVSCVSTPETTISLICKKCYVTSLVQLGKNVNFGVIGPLQLLLILYLTTCLVKYSLNTNMSFLNYRNKQDKYFILL
jgi:hypothetical protein